MGGLDARGGGLRGRVDWRRRLAAAVPGGGGAPAALDGGGRADEHQWATEKLVSGSVGVEEGRTGDLHRAGPAVMAPAAR